VVVSVTGKVFCEEIDEDHRKIRKMSMSKFTTYIPSIHASKEFYTLPPHGNYANCFTGEIQNPTSFIHD